MTNLNGGTLFNAEFGIRHRAAPYRKGQVLHSVFAAADGISAFHQDTPFDKRQREIIIAGSLIGVVLCTVLMTLGVLKARGDLSYLFPAFREMVFILLLSGITLLLVVKAILAQRKDFGIYKGQL
ncbi:TPA: hypothetical protein ACRNUV_000526 [Pseudomonas aeruginosa]